MKTTAAINVAWKAQGLDEDTARDVYERVTGKRRLTLMTSTEQRAVLAEFNGTPGGARAKGLTGPYAKKLQALWIAGWNLGIVQDRRDSAMLSFIKRQTGLESTRFLRDATDAQRVVEALKAWLARMGGVEWGNSCGWLPSNESKIAWAQWQILENQPPRDEQKISFACYALHLSGCRTDLPLTSIRPSDWHNIMNKLGIRVRALP
tara:strand:- start:42898 stop:43515 length:618 start_codon:yes stop_codon:yes gene_type:complete